ncbi:MAG: endonuclease/exonuclease/phosphatase family protein [Candidatus Thiodiazotropha sp.]
MKRLAVVTLLLFFTSAFGETARIATWNLGGFNRIPQSNLNKIIQGLEKLDADVAVLPEINPLSHAEKITEKLSESPENCYQAKVLDQPKARQEIAIIHKCEVTVSTPMFLHGTNLRKKGYRNAIIAKAKVGEFDFILIGLHLKAGRGKTNSLYRDRQLAFISGYIQGVLQGSEKDILVIGDYNMIPGDDFSNFTTLNSDKSLRYVSSEDLIGQGTHISCEGDNVRIGNLLDGYGFTNIDDPEYQENSLRIIQMHTLLGLSLKNYQRKVTNHLPVIAEFNVDMNND